MAILHEKMYKVSVGGDEFVVKAKTKAGALNVVMAQSVKIEPLSAPDAVALVVAGVKVLEAGAADEPTAGGGA